MSLKAVGKLLHAAPYTIKNWLKIHNIPIRINAKPRPDLSTMIPDKHLLEKMYLKQKIPLIYIAEKLNLPYSRVRRYFTKYQIPPRSISERGLYFMWPPFEVL